METATRAAAIVCEHTRMCLNSHRTQCACVCVWVCCVAGCRNETRSYNQYVVIYFRCLPSPLPSTSASVCRFNARRAKFARMIPATLRIGSCFICIIFPPALFFAAAY